VRYCFERRDGSRKGKSDEHHWWPGTGPEIEGLGTTLVLAVIRSLGATRLGVTVTVLVPMRTANQKVGADAVYHFFWGFCFCDRVIRVKKFGGRRFLIG
jgi:hypothetical protein